MKSLTLRQYMALILLMSFSMVSMLFITPALGDFASLLQLTSTQSAELLSFFLLGYALGQLPYGILADRLGRLTTLKYAMLFSLAGSVMAIIATVTRSHELLNLARFIIGFGGAGGSVIVATLINESFEEQQARRILGTVYFTFAFLPCISIFLGGLLGKLVGPAGLLIASGLYNLALLPLIKRLPSPRQQDSACLSMLRLLRNYRHNLGNASYLLCTLTFVCTVCIYCIFTSLAPLVIIEPFSLTQLHFSILMLLITSGVAAGCFVSNHLTRRAATATRLTYGGLSMLVGGCLMLVLCYWLKASHLLLWFSIAGFILFMGHGLVSTNSSVLGIKATPFKASGVSIMYFLSFSLSSLLSQQTSVLLAHSNARVFGEVLLCLAVLATLLFALAHRKIKKLQPAPQISG
ncbi:MFS transporter [Dongshaea marina]|uniref:MFS transporter n=1 Tax=Dongshaea marina TaxID=2047966 RepID=UPI000D3E3057|nr:MFS transporter [Dongshaea marina]